MTHTYRTVVGKAWPLVALLVACSTTMPQAQAALVTDTTKFSRPVIDPAFGLKAPSLPLSYAYHIDFQTTNNTGSNQSVKKFSGGYGFGTNGFWDSSISMTGLNADDGYMDFTFPDGVTVAGIGGFMNYAPESLGGMEITALDANNNVLTYKDDDNKERLESHTLTFVTGGGTNSGAEFYILRDKADIKKLRLSKAFVGITNFTYDFPVPGPLPLLGVAAAFGSSRRIRRRLAGQNKTAGTAPSP